MDLEAKRNVILSRLKNNHRVLVYTQSTEMKTGI